MGLNHKAQQLLEKAIKKNPGCTHSIPINASTFSPSTASPPSLSGNAPLLVNLASNLEPPSLSSPSTSISTTERALLLFGQAIQADPSLMEA
jgi:hypothetical protein